MRALIDRYFSLLHSLVDLAPLAFRLILAYGFYGTALQKWEHIDNVIQWFGEGLHIPFPEANAYMAASTEAIGVVLLIFGLGMRFITIPLMVIMIVAIATVHWKNGFSCGHNGYEIPFYFFFMLLSLLVSGAGKFSLDHVIKQRTSR